jgi:hypothetical protein
MKKFFRFFVPIKLINLFRYIKLIKMHKDELQKLHNIRVDRIYRMWTVLNLIDDKENVDKYGYFYVDTKLKEYVSGIDKFFMKNGLFEFVGLSKADQINIYNILIVIEYKFLSTRKLANRMLLFLLLLLVALFIIIL